MAVDNIYTYDPIKYNNLNQAQSGYPGINKVENYILKEGTILVALEGPKAGAGGNYFMTLDEFKNSNLDSIKLCQGLQVAPYYDKRNKDSQPQYKTNARFYIINEEILSAEGAISANTNYGKGGLQQIVVPNGSEMIKEAYRNDEHSLNDNIIPIDLNKFENDERISGKTKEELNSVKNKFFYNLSDDGSIQLNNKVISEQTYDLIQMRTEIHELTAKNNCLLKEYTDELQKEDKDINYISKISNQISNNESKLNYKKYNFEKNCEYLNEKSSLLDGFTDEQKEHMLNADTCCPKETLEKSEYLKAKASELEKNLSYDEKKQLNIEDDVSSDKVNNFKENTKLEESIKEDYENYTSLDPEGIVNRELIYTPIERDKNEDTDGRRTTLGEKDQLYEENSSDQTKNVDEESSKVYENVEDNENTTANKEESNKNKLESKEKLSEEMEYKNISEDENLEVDAQQNIIEEQIIREKHDENLESNKELDNNEVINSEGALEKVQNQNYLANEETENNKVLEKNLVNDSKADIENDEIKVIDEAAASEVYEEDSALKDVNENLEENQNCEDENPETSKTADDHKDMSIVESTQAEKDQQTEANIEASIKNTNNTEDEIAREEKNKNKLESREELSEEIDYKNIKEDEKLEVDAQQSSIEGQITSEKQDKNLEINKELDNNGAEDKIEGNLEKNKTMDQNENSNKDDNISLELGSYNTMDSKKVLSQMEEQNIDENGAINSEEEALERVQNQNYLANEETENNKVLEKKLVNDSKVYIENDEIKVIDEAAASEVSEEDSDLKDVNENLEENQNCEDENSETSKTADDNKDMSILESAQTEKDQKTDADIEASIKNANNTEDEIAGEGENKNKFESKEELSEEIDHKNINEDENLEDDAQQSPIEGQIISEKQDENLEINKELDNNGAENKIEGNLEKNETMDQDENSNKNDNTSLELGSDNTMDSKKVLSQTEEQNIDENEVINSEEALEKVENQNYLTNEETENNNILEENLVNDSKADIENDEIKVRDEAEAREAFGEDIVLKDANENLEQNQNCEDENFETSKTADDNNDMLSFDDNLEKLDNENCDDNEELKDCDEEAIESSVNCNGTASREESDEDLDEDEDEFYDY